MLADLGFPLEWTRIRAQPLPALKVALQTWLRLENPVCLIHPHGFFIALLGRSETEEWRLHFWPRGPRIVAGIPAFIHTHSCHVESLILKGKLTNVSYSVVAVPTGGVPLYEVNYGGDRYAVATSNLLRKTGDRVQATVQHQRVLTCGDTYHVERFTYHEAVVSDQDATSTLVCMHGRSSGAVTVVGMDGYPETVAFTRSEYRALDFAEWLSP